MNTDKSIIMSRLLQDYNTATKLGHKVLGVFLQGSQNYGLDYEGSDIDTKAIVLPSFDDIVLNRKPVSTTHINEDNSHLDLKDIRLMWECFKKQNINFLEILFTEYYFVNPDYQLEWERMCKSAELIAHYNNYAAVNCIAGMVFEKHKALCHPYPTLKDKIDRYGYDNKQLHHIIRCEEFLDRYIAGVPYKDCLRPTNPEYLIDVKSRYIYSLEEAKSLANEAVARVTKVKEDYMNNNLLCVANATDRFMQEALVHILKNSFLDDIAQDTLEMYKKGNI